MASLWIVSSLLVVIAALNAVSGHTMLGTACSSSAQCASIPNSLCSTRKGIQEQRCYCIDGYRPSDDNKECLYVDVTRFAEGTLNVGEWAGLFIGVSIVVLIAVSCVIHFRNKRNKNVEV